MSRSSYLLLPRRISLNLLPLVAVGLSLVAPAVTVAAPRPMDDSVAIVGQKARRAPLSSTLARFDFESPGGGPDAQGWEAIDGSVSEREFWHVDDFAGVGIPNAPLQGSRSMWCGLRDDPSDELTFDYATLPGYGNDWDTTLLSSPLTMSLPARIQFDALWSTEAAFDSLFVQVRAAPDGAWTTLIGLTGEGFLPALSADLPASLDGEEVQLRFRFRSDGEQSDEDGGFDSNGAVILDDIRVFSGGVLLNQADFESDPVGAQATADGFWTAAPADEPFGLFTALSGPEGVLQEDPAGPNDSHFWTFFQGSTDTYRCGLVPSQPAVPRPLDPANPTRETSFANEIRSPWIPLVVDENGQPAVEDAGYVKLGLRVYRDLESREGVYYIPRVRYRVNGEVRLWRYTAFIYYGPWKQWDELEFEFLIDAGATEVQVGVQVQDLAYALGNLVDDEACHSHGPLIDDVVVSVREPALTVTSTDPDGEGSLRRAILEANASDDLSVITFDIPGAPSEIRFTQPLPPMTTPILLDGRSDPDWMDDPVVGIVFEATDPETAVLELGSDVTIRSIAVAGSTATGIRIDGDRTVVEDVWLGRTVFGSDVGVDHAVEILDGSTDNRVGGPDPGQQCLVAAALGDGVRIVGDGAVRNAVRGVSFVSFGQEPIDLGGNGRDLFSQDDLDVDTGPNQLQNWPDIGFVNGSGGTVEGILRSSPDTDFEIDVFVSTECGNSGYDLPRADLYLGSVSTRTDADGEGRFRLVVGVDLAEGDVITATATDAAGNTSEVSDCYTVVEYVAVTTTADDGPGSLREAILATRSLFGPRVIAFAIPGEGPHTITPLSPLPVVDRSIVIDGFSQLGSSPNTLARGSELDVVWKVALDGSAVGGVGLYLDAEDPVLRGLVIHGFSGGGIVDDFFGGRVYGCAVGVDIEGDPSPNGDGIRFEFRGGDVGGSRPSRRNLIAHNTGDGIYSYSDGLSARGNVIFGNGGLGIDIRSDGPSSTGGTGTDAPIIIPPSAGDSTIEIQLPFFDFRDAWVQVFANSDCDPSGIGEGRALLGEWSERFWTGGATQVSLSTPLLGGEVLTALFHDDGGEGTSEFSACVEVANTPVGVDVSVNPSDGLGSSLPLTVVFDEVSTAGRTLATQDATSPLPTGFELGEQVPFDLRTSAEFSQTVEVCVDYAPADLGGPEAGVALLHYDSSLSSPAWVDVTETRDFQSDRVCGRVSSLSPFVVAVDPTATAVPSGLIQARELGVHPNPFNPSTSVEWTLAMADRVRVEILDLAGRRVRRLHDGDLAAGPHRMVWTGTDDRGRPVASGVYLVVLRGSSRQEVRKVALIK